MTTDHFVLRWFFGYMKSTTNNYSKHIVRVKACTMDLFHTAAFDQFSSSLNLKSQNLRENRRISISQFSEGVHPPRVTEDRWRLRPMSR